MSEQSQLITALIESNKTTLEKVDKLCDSVNNLVEIEARREERDKSQQKFNGDVENHMQKVDNDYRPVIERAKANQEMLDKVKIPIVSAFVLALLAALGFGIGK